MRDRDWFMLGCRLVGVWAAYTALTYISSYVDIKLGYTGTRGEASNAGGYLVHALFHGSFALYLLFGTRHLAWLSYERDEGSKPERPSPPPSAENDLT